MLRIVGIAVIIAIIITEVSYIIRKFMTIKKNEVNKKRNEENIISQIELWENTYQITEKYERDALFSPTKMRNSGIDIEGMAIEILDYTSQVPWFFRI